MGFHYRFLTKEACLVPPVQCMTEDTEGLIYDLSSLREQVSKRPAWGPLFIA